KEILTLKGHSQEVTCVNASPSGRYLLTGSRDGTALVWLAVEWPEKAPLQAAGLAPVGTNGNVRPLAETR
ncbi:MAG TPA: WD40 repeat domain-containing protein, partial [Planctomycetaceae bacterium]|nr:WD40 repeat domain-containing protein [Planctomycetaceae bacterium]